MQSHNSSNEKLFFFLYTTETTFVWFSNVSFRLLLFSPLVDPQMLSVSKSISSESLMKQLLPPDSADPP